MSFWAGAVGPRRARTRTRQSGDLRPAIRLLACPSRFPIRTFSDGPDCSRQEASSARQNRQGAPGDVVASIIHWVSGWMTKVKD